MGFFKKFTQKAKELNEKLNSEGGLVDKVKELQETINGEGADAITKCMAAGQFISDLGILKERNADNSGEIESEEENESLDTVDFSDLSEVSEEYKKRFEEEHGISYDEYMADIMENADKPLDDETIDFIRNFGKV